jgi:short-subunit dehydrogenase
MVNVKDMWCLVTGASRGVGKQIALFMARNGANLILHSRDLTHTQKVADEAMALGVKVKCVCAELSAPGSVSSMLSEIDSLNVYVGIVFNDAGVQIAYRTNYFETPPSDYVTSLLINTVSPALICYHFIPKMLDGGFGRIINTSSGIQNEPEQAGYSASKYALNRITLDLGSKLKGVDVCINLADPGWLRTDLGGPNAPGSVESCIPGMVVGAFIDDKKSGRYFSAQSFTGMPLEEAVALAEKI